MYNAKIVYVSAAWNGQEMEPDDMAVDMEAGGRGIKGIKDPNGTVHSAFAYVVSMYAKREDAEALRDLVKFVDIHDAHGSVVNYLIKSGSHEARRILAKNNIGSAFRALTHKFPDSPDMVFNRMSEILDGLLEMWGRAERRARKEADQAEIFCGGRIALLRSKKEQRTTQILFERGVEVIVYTNGFNIGVRRRGDGFLLADGTRFRADHPKIRRVVELASDVRAWFAHSKGFLYCHGSSKAPAISHSKVNPYDLIKVIIILMTGSMANASVFNKGYFQQQSAAGR